MRKLFELDEVNRKTNVKNQHSDILVERFLNAHDHRIESIKQLAGRLPAEGEIFFLWTLKSFNAFTFIPFVIRQTGCIQELVISTYSISTRIVDALMKLIEHKKVEKVHLLISDSLQYRLPRVHDHLQALTSNRQEITVCYSWNHSKIALMHAGAYRLVVEGSGNFGENAQHEQYIFYNMPSVFEFRKKEIYGIHTRTN